MKILAILTYYAPHWTGLTRYAQSIAEGLAERGHEVRVLATGRPARERINGVDVVRAPAWARFSRGVIAPGFLWQAARLIRQADVVQIHTPLPEAALVALLCRGKPLIMTHHGDIVMPSGALNRVLEESAYWILRSAAGLADAVLSYSQDYAASSRLLAPLGAKTRAIAPFVRIQPVEHRGLEGKRVIGFAGRWVEEKGFDYLLAAIPEVVRRIPDAHFIYAGEPPVYERFYERCRGLVEAHRDRLTFLGLLPREKMPDFYGMCDVFALPSRSDMFALVQLEAMLCGVPVVSTDIPGARVPVCETGYGLLCRPRDTAALAAALCQVLENPASFRPDPARVAALYSPQRCLDEYERLFHIVKP